MRRLLPILLPVLLASCATVPEPRVAAPGAPIEVQILGINDFHGNLQASPDPVSFAMGPDTKNSMRLGGAAQLGAALRAIRTARSITVAAGDLIGATPLESAYFLDEPAIDAMNLIGLELASVGNHEFDKGSAELLRMQHGGCAKLTTIANREPCRLEPFTGARFHYLSANVRTPDGRTLFPASEIRQIGPVRIGFIGMTLRDTAKLVSPAGVAGLSFADEAATANALVPGLKAAGADAIVLLIHQGGKLPESYHVGDCDGLSGAIMPILDALDPAIRTIVSGHTHNAYACTLDRGGASRLLTSAGKYGYFATDLRLAFDPRSHALVAHSAHNLPVAGDGAGQADVAQLVERYVAAVKPAADRVVGRLPATLAYEDGMVESPVADMVADAQLAATRAPGRGGAQLSFLNGAGARATLAPRADGTVTYGQLFALQPFGNSLVVKSYTGAELRAALEQQVQTVDGKVRIQSSLVPSANVRVTYDLVAPVGARIVSVTVDGRALDPTAMYRVTINNFLASGGDGYSVLAGGRDAFDAGLDLDATEAWIAGNPGVPVGGRLVAVNAR